METKEVEFDAEGILNLKMNIIPKGMVELERLFYPDRLSINQSTQGNECEAINLGTNEWVKNVFVGKVCTLEEKEGIL